MARKLISEILEEVAQVDSIEDKAEILRKNYNPTLCSLLKDVFDPNEVYDVEIPSYRENFETAGYASNNLYVEQRRLYLFKSTEKKVAPKRKSVLLAQVLESIDAPDALVLINVINKDLSKYGITQEVVDQAFPNLLP